MRHPDFRVRGTVFATLGYPSDDYGVLMFSPREQRRLVSANVAAIFQLRRERFHQERRAPQARDSPSRTGILKLFWTILFDNDERDAT